MFPEVKLKDVSFILFYIGKKTGQDHTTFFFEVDDF